MIIRLRYNFIKVSLEKGRDVMYCPDVSSKILLHNKDARRVETGSFV